MHSLLRAKLLITGADPGYEKGGGVGGSGASFWAYLGKFRGLFKEFGAITGGRAPPCAPPLDPRLINIKLSMRITVTKISLVCAEYCFVDNQLDKGLMIPLTVT